MLRHGRTVEGATGDGSPPATARRRDGSTCTVGSTTRSRQWSVELDLARPRRRHERRVCCRPPDRDLAVLRPAGGYQRSDRVRSTPACRRVRAATIGMTLESYWCDDRRTGRSTRRGGGRRGRPPSVVRHRCRPDTLRADFARRGWRWRDFVQGRLPPGTASRSGGVRRGHVRPRAHRSPRAWTSSGPDYADFVRDPHRVRRARPRSTDGCRQGRSHRSIEGGCAGTSGSRRSARRAAVPPGRLMSGRWQLTLDWLDTARSRSPRRSASPPTGDRSRPAAIDRIAACSDDLERARRRGRRAADDSSLRRALDDPWTFTSLDMLECGRIGSTHRVGARRPSTPQLRHLAATTPRLARRPRPALSWSRCCCSAATVRVRRRQHAPSTGSPTLADVADPATWSGCDTGRRHARACSRRRSRARSITSHETRTRRSWSVGGRPRRSGDPRPRPHRCRLIPRAGVHLTSIGRP